MRTHHSRSISLAVLVAAFVAAFGFWQYRFYRTPLAVQPEASLESRFISGGPGPGDIPAIDAPSFESVLSADQYLDNNGLGLVVSLGGRPRFYPFQILVWHFVVNDTFGSQPIVITYDPLTQSGMAFSRVVNGQATLFSVSGKLLDSNLLMTDALTGSLWSQVRAQAVAGDKTGTSLEKFPALVTRWELFKQQVPDGLILARDSHLTRDYTWNPYRDYQSSHALWFPVVHKDERLEAKQMVYGLKIDDGAQAVTPDTIKQQRAVSFMIGTTPVIILWDDVLETARAFRCDLTDGLIVEIARRDDAVVDAGTSSVWNAQGQAVSGPLRGTQLKPMVLDAMYWFAWASAHPETKISPL
ncbi:DUF3179 domain-containing protein [Candidatus Uhrbacteria bacterium]|nr:DUF3179 domain-containing protein [Candidatus Uhrbacteria bacterium]